MIEQTDIRDLGTRYHLNTFFSNVSPTQVRAKSFIYYFMYGKPLLLPSCYQLEPLLNEEWLAVVELAPQASDHTGEQDD